MRNLDDVLTSAALPALSDPSSIAAAAPNKLQHGVHLLNTQLKLHLLTSEHLVLSHGFLYDNPAIWDTLDETLIRGLTERRRDGFTTLILQVNDTSKQPGSPEFVDDLFRVWAFGADGARPLEPSAARLLGLDQAATAQALTDAKARAATISLYDYAGLLGLDGLRAATGQIHSLLNTCSRHPKPSGRYDVFSDLVRSYFSKVRKARDLGMRGAWEKLYPDVDQTLRILGSMNSVSRSAIEKQDRSLWWRIAPWVNHFRLRGYLPPQARGAMMSYLPSKVPDAVNTLINEMAAAEGASPKWVVALEKLPFKSVFELRARASFRNVLERLGSAAKHGDLPTAYEDYGRILRDEWAKHFIDGVSDLAKDCVVDAKLGDGKWITPTAITTGFAAGAATFAAVSAATPAGLVAMGVNGLTYYGILGARRIIDHIRVNTPEKAAHLVAAQVLDYFPRS